MPKGCVQYSVILVVYFTSACYGLSTYYCTHGTEENVYISNGTARIVTRRSGTNSYENNMECFWHISTDVGKRLHFKVIQTNLQYAPENANCHSYDHVAFKEENIADDYDWSNAELGMYFTWCGDMNPYYFSSKDNNVYIEFHTNDRNTYIYSGVTLEVTVFDANDCPPEWIQESSRQTDYCYKLRNHKENWADAQLYCNKERSNLVSFADENEADFVTGIMQNATGLERHDRVWIGLNDIRANSEYKWIDKIDSTVLYRWRDSPHSADVYDSCVSMQYNDGKWQEEFCTLSDIQTVTKNKFICKTMKDGTTQMYKIPSEDKDGEPEAHHQGAPLVVIVVGFVLTFLVIVGTLVVVVYLIIRVRSRNNPSQRDGNKPVVHEMAALSTGGEQPLVSGSRPQATAPLMNDNDVPPAQPPPYTEIA